MKLECYRIDDSPLDIRPAGRQREWMDRTPGAFAYRCLPVAVANQHGWVLCCTESFTAEWNGGAQGDDVKVTREGEPSMDVVGHFGSGVLSIRSRVIFRTEEGFNLWVTGPPNEFKDGIQPLSAVVESDWMPFPFHMSWKFTRPNQRICFAKGEPYCFVFPFERGVVQRCKPTLRRLEDDPELVRLYRVAHYRREFPQALEHLKGVDPGDEKWQGWYSRGALPDESARIEGHERRLRLEPFEREDD